MQPVQRSQLAWRWLGLTFAVLLLHLWLLGALPVPWSTHAYASPQRLPFATRTLAAPSVTDTPTAKTVALVPDKTRPHMTAPSATRRTQPAPVPQPVPASDAFQPMREPPAASTQLAANAAHVTAVSGVQTVSAVSANAASAAVGVPVAPQAGPKAARAPSGKPMAVSGKALSASTRLIYQVKASRFPYRLSGELLWRNEGDRYQALLRYSALGLTRAQTSRGRITDLGLAPERFSDKYRSEVAAHFNYEQAKVTFSANTPDAPLLAGAQDRLSVLIQLGALVAGNREQIGPGSTLSIQTVGARAADLWLFTVAGTEALNLPGGQVDGVKLERLPREPYDQKVQVWLAPQLGYLPARIRITETNGESIDQLWQATEPVDADASVPESGAPAAGH